MDESKQTIISIQIALPTESLVLVYGTLIYGEIYGRGKNINYFVCRETGGKWNMAAISLPTQEKLAEKTLSFGLEHIEGSKELKAGYTLVSE